MAFKIIDVHTHAFPDFLAEKAVKTLGESSGHYRPKTNGTIKNLLEIMDKHGIEKSFIANIATNPEQFNPILKWSESIHSARIIPLCSINPESKSPDNEIKTIKAKGFPGIKLHPMYQKFALDEERMFPVYESVIENNLFILFHTGYDIGFPGNRNASSLRLKKVINKFPNMKIIASHVGGWSEWEEVQENIVGANIYFDTSFMHEIKPELMKKILSEHDSEKFLFGSDSPWLSQEGEIDFINNLKISDDFKEKIFYTNAENLLKSVSYQFRTS